MQAKTKKKLLIVGGLAVFLLLVTTFSNGQIAHAIAPQCSDGIDNDGDTLIDEDDPNCHTDLRPFDPVSYDSNLNDETGPSCACPYQPKAGRIIVQVDCINKIKSNGTLAEGRTPAISVNIPVGYYNVSIDSVDGYANRPFDAPQSNEIWKALLMSGSELVTETISTNDLPDIYDYISQRQDNIQTNFFVAKDVDSVIGQHAAYPDVSSSNDLWPACVAFDPINQPPVITLLGLNPMTVQRNATFTDPGATSSDPEDGNLTSSITATGTVNTSATGTYSILYTVADSGGLIATTSRIVNVVLLTQCSDGIDNDGDGTIDMADPGCSNPNDNSENQPPVITLLGLNPMTVQRNATFTDPGATSSDPEDGNLTSSITATGTVNTSATGTYSILYTVADSGGLIATTSRTVFVVLATTTNQAPVITIIGGADLEIFVGDAYTDQGATALDFEDGNITSKITTTSTVNTSFIGTYNVYYNATDSQNLVAVEKVRTVVVKARPTGCVSNCGGGGGGGGGFSGPTSLIIFDEKVESQSTTSALVTWKTDTSADSLVVYGTNSINSLSTNNINYGYVYTTQASSTAVLSHSMLITGLLPQINYYFRPVSDNPYVNPVVGKELSLIISQQPIVIIPQAIPQIISPVAVDCNYLLEYLRIDLPNNPVEVVKLQKFLKENENFTNLQVNGVFGQTTLNAVNIFQMRYFADVLSPWGYASDDPTGYVYITTKKKVNEIYCQKPFPLTQEQIDEIISVRNEGNFLQTSPSSTSTSIFGIANPDITEPISAEPITSEPSQIIGQTESTKPIQGLVAGISDDNQEEQGNQGQSIFTASVLSNMPSTKTFLVIALILVILLVGLTIFFVLIKRRKRIVNAEELVIQ